MGLQRCTSPLEGVSSQVGEERQREGAVAPKPRILDHGFGYGEEERSVCPREPGVRRAAVNWEKQGGEQHFLRSWPYVLGWQEGSETGL